MVTHKMLKYYLPLCLVMFLALSHAATQPAAQWDQNSPALSADFNTKISTETKSPGEPLSMAETIAAGYNYLRFMQADVTEDNAGNGEDGVDETPDDPDDGGWDWKLTYPADPLAHSVNASPTNIYGATGMALILSNDYPSSLETELLYSSIDASTVMKNNASIRSANDIIFLLKMPSLPGLKDSAKTKFDARVATYGSAAAFAEYIRDARNSQGYANGILAWDIGLWVKAAALLDIAFPDDPNDYGQAAIDMAEVLWQDSYNDNPGFFDIIDDQGYDPNGDEVNYWWYNLGISGLIFAFDYSGVHTDEIDGLVDILLQSQNSYGFFSYQYGGNYDDAGWQSTAYAVMALGELYDDPNPYQTEINNACYWTAATFDASNGGWIYDNGNHYPEINGENLYALTFGQLPETLYVDDDFIDQAAVDSYNSAAGLSLVLGFSAFSNIQDAIDHHIMNSSPDQPGSQNFDITIMILDGEYNEPMNIEWASAPTAGNTISFDFVGESNTGTIIKPSSYYTWDVGGYTSRRAGVRVVNPEVYVRFNNLNFDFEYIAANNTAGILMWNTQGEISDCILHDISFSDVYNGYTELTCYLRAPDFTNEDRAHIDVLNNTFTRCGRLGVVAHDYVDVLIEGNTFDKDEEDFGYGIEIGSMASAVVRENIFKNFATWAASDQSVAAGILVENSFTQAITTPLDKQVVITDNDISLCQYGIYVGNNWEGLAGSVNINVTIDSNNIYDATTSGSWASGGIVLTDEGYDVGSSVNAIVHDNRIENNDDYGVYIYTNGNGEINTWFTYNWVLNNYQGLNIKDYGAPSTSVYNLVVHHNLFFNNLNANNDVLFGYWDDNISEGNCWSDYDMDAGGEYLVPGNGGAIDRYPNVYCGGCVPGDANNNGIINIIDITYLIDAVYYGGTDPVPYPICSGDPYVDCVVNILDITTLIEYLYMDGEPPGNGGEWLNTCNWPFRSEPDNDDPAVVKSADNVLPVGKAVGYK